MLIAFSDEEHGLGNGFIGKHIVLQLLDKGHDVITTIRTLERQKETASCIPEAHASKIAYAIVKDGGVPNAYDEVSLAYHITGCVLKMLGSL